MSSAFTICTPGIGTLSYSLISSEESSAQFQQLMPFTILQFLFHQVYPSLLGGQRWHDMRGLPKTSTHGWQCDSALVTHPSTNYLCSETTCLKRPHFQFLPAYISHMQFYKSFHVHSNKQGCTVHQTTTCNVTYSFLKVPQILGH